MVDRDTPPGGVNPDTWEKLMSSLEANRRPGADAMTGIHEMYLDFQSGGFTADESLRIIAYGLFHRIPLADADDDDKDNIQ